MTPPYRMSANGTLAICDAVGNRWAPDPPGTINPAKLSIGAGAMPGTFENVATSYPPTSLNTQTAQEGASQSICSEALTPAISPSAVPRLSRISSDWDPKDDIVTSGMSNYGYARVEFESSHVEMPRPSAKRARYTSHRGYFLRQIMAGMKIYVPADPAAGPDSSVVVDMATASIYDAYLLRADITKNTNIFWRHQIVFSPDSGKYTLLTREGRVGLQGEGKQAMESADLKAVAARFRKIFRERTGLSWNRRYEIPPSWLGERFVFIELDYHRAAATQPKELPNYETVNVKIDEEVKDLMEVMLYGSPVRKCTESETPGTPSTWSAFAAPYEYLSTWAIFLAFKTLQCISRSLESGLPLHWKAILKATSRYRSHIPFCAGRNRAPVISSYHAIFIELRFLHSLWPHQEITNMLIDTRRRASLQLNKYNALAQPLYQAYSSLRHGFRRLTDASTLEFQELKNYLEKSCHRAHCLTLELQDIYRVFIKTNLRNPYRDWIEGKQGGDICGEERLLLWHGTPLDSLLGILDLGLQIRRRGATWTGTMFGNGIYLADASSKSAGFCKHRLWDGEAVLLLCEADVGAERIRSPRSMANGNDIVGMSCGLYRCIEGLGKIGPRGWKDIGWEMGGLSGVGGVVRMPDTSVPYSDTYSGGILGFNESAGVIVDPIVQPGIDLKAKITAGGLVVADVKACISSVAAIVNLCTSILVKIHASLSASVSLSVFLAVLVRLAARIRVIVNLLISVCLGQTSGLSVNLILPIDLVVQLTACLTVFLKACVALGVSTQASGYMPEPQFPLLIVSLIKIQRLGVRRKRMQRDNNVFQISDL